MFHNHGITVPVFFPLIWICGNKIMFWLVMDFLSIFNYLYFGHYMSTYTPIYSRYLTMKFRNYVPHDKQLQEGKLPPPVLPKFDDPVAAAPPPSDKKEVFLLSM